MGHVVDVEEQRTGMLSLPLADEFFLVSHDEYNGKSLINDEILDVGLSGAVLGELVLANRISIGADTVVIVRDQRPYGERVSDAALAELLKVDEPTLVSVWVKYLRTHARNMVAPRLINAQIVERVHSRVMLRQVTRFPARDPLMAASPRARLRYMFDHPQNLDEQTAILGGLVRATELDYVLGAGTPREAREGLDRMANALGQDLRGLCAGVQEAVASLALIK
jgi:Golgi phosphoprotein 3 (GPP34)